MTIAFADSYMEASLTGAITIPAQRIAAATLTYVPKWSTCEYCDAEVTNWVPRNGYATCPECGTVN